MTDDIQVDEDQTPGENPEEKQEEPKEPEVEAPKEEPPKEPDAEEPPKETPTEEEAEESPEEQGDLGYTTYDDPALNQVVTLLKDADLPVAEANAIFAEAVESGDMSKIDRESLEAKLGKDKADIVLILAESAYKSAAKDKQVILDEAYTLTGGEDNFNSMREWATTKAESDTEFAKDLSELREMMDSPKPRIVRAALQELFDTYRQDPSTTIEANIQVGDKAASAYSLEALSRADYTDLVEKAHREGTYDQVHKGLWTRRNAGIKKGI